MAETASPPKHDQKTKSLDEIKEEINEILDKMKIADYPLPKDKKIIEIKSNTSVKDTVDILMKNHIHSAPVVDVKAKPDADWLDKYTGLVDMMDVSHFVLSLVENPDKKLSTRGYVGLTEENQKISSTTAGEIAGISGNNPFVGLDVNSSIRDAMLLLGKRHLYRIAAIDGKKQELVNIISQSTIIKLLSDNLGKFSGLVDKSLKELGLADNKKVLSVPIHTPAIAAFKLIAENRVGAIPIIGVAGAVIANISAADMRAVLSSPSLYGALYLPLSSFLSLANEDRVDVMSPAITCHPSATLKHVIQQLVVSHIHRMYVVDERQHLISVVSLTDVISTIVTEPQTLNINV